MNKMDKFFKISERGSNVRTEITAGLTTFFAMAYIVVTNPNQVLGFTTGGVFDNLWNAVYIASILVAVIGTLLYSLYARLPFAQACGMGLNSFFFVSFILPALLSGSDPVEGYRQGLCIILVSGIIFLILSITGARKHIARALPDCLKKAIPAGIGLFIALIGFKNVGIIQANQYTFVQLFDFHGAITADGVNGFMDAWKAIAPVVLALLGLFLIAILDHKKVKGSVIITILSVTVVYYLSTWTLPSFDLSKVGQSFKDFGDYAFLGAFKGFSIFSGGASAIVNAIVLTITFCLVDMFDTIGTLIGVSSKAGMLDENEKLPRIKPALLADAIATSAGAIFGTSTTTTYVESSAGVGAGARTGLASVTTGILFLLAIFFAPIFTAIPGFATAPALIFVGFLMVSAIVKIDFEDLTEAIPAYLCVIAMPLMYSIAEGIAIGVISYVVINLICGKAKKITPLMYVLAVLFVCKYIFL